MRKITKRTIYDYVLIIFGTTLMAFAIVYFYDANTLVIGGVSGLSIIISSYGDRIGLSIPLWLSNLALNAPLFLLALRYMGRQFLTRTLFSTIYLSVALYFASLLPLSDAPDLVLSSVFGGVLSGIGAAFVFKASATTGGSDMAAFIIQKKLRHVSVSKILFTIDGAIILLGLLAFGPLKTMYAIIAVFIASKAIDAVLEGLSFAKAAFIISDHSEKISESLLSGLERGVTSLNGQGMYTKASKNILLCVVSSKELPKLKEITHGIDNDAFVIVADVREVMGEGFTKSSGSI
ncbi:MAG: YitT family protein [Clostridiales bacterium]|nr:YitT family protein [Clostridiales bacterium]